MRLLVVFSLFAFVYTTSAQRIAEGYIIGLNNDSVAVTFKLPKSMPAPIMKMYDQPFDFFHLKDEVEVIRDNGEPRWVTPRNARRLSFTYDSRNYELVSKPISPYQRNFLSPEILGTKIKLYNYTIVHQGTAYYGNGMKAKGGSSPWKEYFWTIEKNDGSYLFINSRMRKRELRMMLSEFFRDQHGMLQLIDQQFHGWFVNIPETVRNIVDAYNRN